MGAETPLTNHAQAFLKLLDPMTERFCVRAFTDSPIAPDLTWAPKSPGTLPQYFAGLKSRNQRGAGVGVVINEGGQKKADITRVRAVFADTDGADLCPIVAALRPHIVVNSSPGKWHVYWLVTDDFPLDRFGSVQRAIAEKFSTDDKVVDLPRVMRLPGFYHNKAKPYLVRLVDWDALLPRYSFDQIIEGLGINLASGPSLSPTAIANPPPHRSAVWRKVLSGQFTKSEIEGMLAFIDPGCNRKEWMDVLFVLAFELGEDGRELADRWSRGDFWSGAVR